MSDRKDDNPLIDSEPLCLGMGSVTIKDLRRLLGIGGVTINDLVGVLVACPVVFLRPPILDQAVRGTRAEMLYHNEHR